MIDTTLLVGAGLVILGVGTGCFVCGWQACYRYYLRKAMK